MKTITTFLNTHRQLLLVVGCSLFFFLLFSANVFANNHPADQPAVDDGIWGIADTVLDTIAGIIYYFCVGIGGIFIGIGGWMLDTAVTQTILEADTWLSPGKGGLGDSIQALWVVIRDMLNILFIFSLIYIGIKTILDSGSSETRRSLGYLIIAALLINFSLFFTQVIVDFSNIAAIQIYNQIQTGLGNGANIAGQQLSSSGIAAGFMNIVQVGTFFSTDTKSLSDMAFTQQILYSLLMLVFFIIAGIIFMMGAVLLIRRFITIILIMIFSPTLFAGWILPAFEEHQKKWRRKLLENAFFAPAFFFMLFLSIHVLQSLSGLIGDSSEQGFSSALETEGYIKLVFFFALAIGFLYASIKIGESMSIAGASGVMKTTQKAIGGATFGLGARLGRNTAGRWAQGYADSDKAKDWASRSLWGKAALKGTRVVGDSSMDLRAAGVGGGYIGQARKGGYKTVTNEIIDKEKKFAESLGGLDHEDGAVHKLEDEEHEMEDELTALKRDRDSASSKEERAEIDKLIKEKQAEIKLQKEYITREKNRRQIGANVFVTGDTPKARADARALIMTKFKELQEIQKDLKVKFDKNTTLADQALVEKIAEAEENLATRTYEAEKIINDSSKTQLEKDAAKNSISEAKNTHANSVKTSKQERNKHVNNLKKTYDDETDANIKLMTKEAQAIKDHNEKAKKAKETAQDNASTSDRGYAGYLEDSTKLQSYAFARLNRQDKEAGKAIRKQYKKGRLKDDAHGHDDHSPAPAGEIPAGGAHPPAH